MFGTEGEAKDRGSFPREFAPCSALNILDQNSSASSEPESTQDLAIHGGYPAEQDRNAKPHKECNGEASVIDKQSKDFADQDPQGFHDAPRGPCATRLRTRATPPKATASSAAAR